ncbi:MAG: hypothetical protein ACKOZM_07075 [Flavobacteriales bacterium]
MKSSKAKVHIAALACLVPRSLHFILAGMVALTSFISTKALSQGRDTTSITILGELRDEMDQPIPNAIIINRTNKKGSFGKPNGSFEVRCQRGDTLAITSLGFQTRYVTYADSLYSAVFKIRLYLDMRSYMAAEVEVFAPRDLEQIQADIEKLGYNEKDYMISGINAVLSPITFLYQQFSKKEQSKRKVAYLENEDRKRELLKELFRLYVDYEIIALNDELFDDFITYLNVSDDFLINSTQYDFLVYVKDRFRDYKIFLRQHQLMKPSDFDYDKD